MGSILGAPRTLGALARDGLAPRFLGRMKNGQLDLLPALVVSLLLALAAVFLGDLNAVASVVTMFFLTVYGTVNFVAAFEALSGDPSWRPGLASPWLVNLLGGVACLAVMLLISPLAGVVALVAELVLWLALSRRERKAGWGDARRGLYESLIRWTLIRLDRHPMTPRNWRPHVLVFVDDIRSELDLVRFGDWFSQGRGVVTVCKLEVGDLLDDDVPDLKAEAAAMRERPGRGGRGRLPRGGHGPQPGRRHRRRGPGQRPGRHRQQHGAAGLARRPGPAGGVPARHAPARGPQQVADLRAHPAAAAVPARGRRAAR